MCLKKHRSRLPTYLAIIWDVLVELLPRDLLTAYIAPYVLYPYVLRGVLRDKLWLQHVAKQHHYVGAYAFGRVAARSIVPITSEYVVLGKQIMLYGAHGLSGSAQVEGVDGITSWGDTFAQYSRVNNSIDVQVHIGRTGGYNYYTFALLDITWDKLHTTVALPYNGRRLLLSHGRRLRLVNFATHEGGFRYVSNSIAELRDVPISVERNTAYFADGSYEVFAA